MDDDETLRTFLLVLMALIAVIWPLAGHWPRLAGVYAEGERRIELGHLGPLVWGGCTVPGGHERYLGLALFGRLRLRRYDAGANHLIEMGFPRDEVAALDGACTGSFSWRQVAGDLTGHFYGRRYHHDGTRMVPVERLAPVARTWRRLSASP